MADERKRTLVTKDAGEDFLLGIDFTDELFGRTISSAAVTTYRAELRAAGTTANNELTPTTPTVNGAIVSLRLVSGVYGQSYISYVRATLNTTEIISHRVDTEIW